MSKKELVVKSDKKEEDNEESKEGNKQSKKSIKRKKFVPNDCILGTLVG